MKKTGVLFLCLGLFVCGCGKEDSGAYDRGLAAMEAGNYPEAVVEFQKAAEDDDRKAEAYRSEGIIYLDQGNYETAISCLNLSLTNMQYENAAFSDDVNYYLAKAYVANGQISEAQQIYIELQEGETPAQAYLESGILYLEQGNTAEAEEAFQSCLDEDPKLSYYIQIYDAYKDCNMEADGAAYLKEAVSLLDEGNTDEEYEGGELYYYLGDTDKAIEYLSKAADRDEEDAIALLGDIYLEKGDVDSARSVFQTSLDKGEYVAGACNGLALCDIQAGEYEAAMQHIEQGLAAAGEDEQETLLFNQIVVLEKQLQFDAAQEKLSAFLEMYPDNAQAQREQTFLNGR